MVWATALAAVAGAAAKSEAAAPAARPDVFSPYQPINIAPVGVNLGEIFKDMSTGPPENGGTPVSMSWPISSFGSSSPMLDAVLDPEGNNDVSMPVFIVAGLVVAGSVGYYLMRK
jgi:hypothetical protein